MCAHNNLISQFKGYFILILILVVLTTTPYQSYESKPKIDSEAKVFIHEYIFPILYNFAHTGVMPGNMA